MKKGITALLLIIMSLILVTSCNQDQSENMTRNVSLSLGNVHNPNSRTIIPSEYVQPDSFFVVLTPVGGNGVEWKNDEALKLGAGNSLTLNNVMLGTYTISVTGQKDGKNVMKGESQEGESLNVRPEGTTFTTPDGSGNLTIMMDVIKNEGQGNVQVTLDWSAVASDERIIEYFAQGGLGLTFEMWEIGGEKLGHVSTTDSSQTRLTLNATLPVTRDENKDVYFKLYSGNTLITENLRRSNLYVYAENTSVDSEGDIVITSDDISWGTNVKNTRWDYNEKGDVIITWDNRFNRETQLFDHVVVSYAPQDSPDETSGTVPAYFRDDNTNSKTGSVTLSGLIPDIPYTISIKAYHKSGLESPDTVQLFDEPVKAKVVVTGITINGEDTVSATAGDTITVKYTITPEKASITKVEWEYDSSAFELTSQTDDSVNGSAMFKILKAGANTLTVKSTDPAAQSGPDSITVNAKLATPSVRVEQASDGTGLAVSWKKIADATSYSVTKKTNGIPEEAVEITENSEDVTVSGDTITWTDHAIHSSNSYQYSVFAKNDSITGFNATSSAGESGEYKVPESSITVQIPEGSQNLEITPVSTNGLLALFDDNSLTFSIGEIEGVDEIRWYFNNDKNPFYPDAEGYTVTITRSTYEYYFDNSVSNGKQTLKIEIDINGQTYSGSAEFFNIETPVESLKITGSQSWMSVTDKTWRMSTKDSDGNPREFQLGVSFNPAEPTLKDVVYSTDDAEGKILTVDPNTGVVTLTGGYGQATITATSYGGKEVVTDTITLDIYVATVTSPTQLVNAVNILIRNELTKANSTYDFDWYTTSGINDSEYKNNGFIAQNRVLAGREGFIKINFSKDNIKAISNELTNENKVLINQIGIASITSGEIKFGLIENSILAAGTDYISSIATTPSILSIELPYNQGKAYIELNNIIFRSESTTNTRSGKYTVTSDQTLGTNEIASKFNEVINDADGTVTKLLN